MRWLSQASKLTGIAASVCAVAGFVLAHFFSDRASKSGGTPPPGGSITSSLPNINIQINNSPAPDSNGRLSPAPAIHGAAVVSPATLPVNMDPGPAPEQKPAPKLEPQPVSRPQPKPEPKPVLESESNPTPPQLQAGRLATLDLGGAAMTRSIFDGPRGGLLPGRELKDGTEVKVLELKSGWARIQWTNDRAQTGWIEQKLINLKD